MFLLQILHFSSTTENKKKCYVKDTQQEQKKQTGIKNKKKLKKTASSAQKPRGGEGVGSC